MKKIIIASLLLAFVCTLTAATAMADDITGKFGVTGRVGFLVPANSDFEFNVDTDVGIVGGGGFIYGFTRNIALELDITHTDFNGNAAGKNVGSFETNNISLGAQYRFPDLLTHLLPHTLPDLLPRLTPYVGGGLDILLNDFTAVDGTKTDVDAVIGLHLSGGADYFLTKQLALTGQMKFVMAPNADINLGGRKIGNFDPMNFSMTFGVRYFFK